MRSARQNSTHAPSVRTSSSHRSTIETRGAPEFDRDYARQLSVAKRGRNGSVKPSPRGGSTHESPLEESGIGHFQGSAAAAATRIKDYVATHVTPPRPFQSGASQHRASDSMGGGGGGPQSANGSPPPAAAQATSTPVSKAGASPRDSALGAATPSVNEDGTAETNSPPAADSGRSTRRGSATSSLGATRRDDSPESVLIFAVKTVALCALVLFVALCAVSFIVSSDQDYNPTYFNLGGLAQKPSAQRGVKAAARSFPDRFIPQFNRQVALHTRRLLGQAVDFLGLMKVVRFCGRVLQGMLRPFRYAWYVLNEGVISPIRMVLPEVDVRLHPTLRYIFSPSTESAEGWSISRLSTLLGSLARSLLQLVVEPVFIIGRTMRSLGDGVAEGVRLLSAPAVGQSANTTTTATAAPHRLSKASLMSRATSSLLLTMWRPLHSVWAMVAPASAENVSRLARHANESLHAHTATTAPPVVNFTAVTTSASDPTPAPTPAAAKKETPPPAMPVRTTHTHRVNGQLWATLLDQHHDEILRLARADLREAFGDDARVEDVRLRPGSLVLDFAVVGPSAIATGTEDASAQQKAAQSQRSQLLSHHTFSRLQAFYEASAAELEREKEQKKTEAINAAEAQCNERVSACEHECEAAQQSLRDEMERNCAETTAEAQRSCDEAKQAAANAAEAALRNCQASADACSAREHNCTTRLSQTQKQLARLEAEKRDNAAALAAAQQALSTASAGHANESEAEKKRCALRVNEVAQGCTRNVQEVRASLEADHAKQVESVKRACEEEMRRVEGEACTQRLNEAKNNSGEQLQLAVQQAGAACEERLAKAVGALNRTAKAALLESERRLNTSVAEAAQRLLSCETSSKQAMAHWAEKEKELAETHATELATTQKACEEKERAAASANCAAQLATREKQLTAACKEAVQQAEAKWREQLSHDVAAFNSSAATTLAQLRATLDATKRDADDSIAACLQSKGAAAAACSAAQRELNATWSAQLASAKESCNTALDARLEAERAMLRHEAAENWTRQSAALSAQCSSDREVAVAAVTTQLEAQHATTLKEVKTALEKQRQEELDNVKTQTETARAAAEQHHATQLHSCQSQLTNCVSETRAIQAEHQRGAEEARLQVFAYLARSGEEACLELTQGNKQTCAAERKKIETALAALPATATVVEALSVLRMGGARGGAAAAGHLTWNFTGSGVVNPRAAAAQQSKRTTPLLHLAGMIVGLSSAAYALYRRQHDRRVYKDTIAQLNALITANETTMALQSPHSQRSSRRGRYAIEDASQSWALAAAYVAHCTEALTSWHFTCCAVLLEEAANEMLLQRCDGPASALSAASHNSSVVTLNDAQTLSLSRGALHTSLVSPSTLPLTDADASRVDSAAALTHMHESFVTTYYNILEMYYVDLLNAVANRELSESQLQEAEAVASRQASILHKQSAAVAQLKLSLAEKEKELTQLRAAATTAAGTPSSSTDTKLARAERKTEAQQVMIALLEGQLKLSKEELDRARGGVQTPARTPRSETGVDSSAVARQIRSLQELAAAEGDSTNSSDFSNVGRPSPQRATATPPPPSSSSAAAVGPHTGSHVGRGVSGEVQRQAPASAMKKPASMMRDPESTRRFQKLRWNDEAGVE